MAVYVDRLRIRTRRAGCCGVRSKESSHLVADTLKELHEFAGRLGLKRSQFQNMRGKPHYKLTKRKRREALAMGAEAVGDIEALSKAVLCDAVELGTRRGKDVEEGADTRRVGHATGGP